MGLFLLAARWFIAGIFLRSGIAKAAGLAEFRSAVANYQLLPPVLVTAVAATLPFAEIAAGALLAAGVLPGLVTVALAGLLAAFAVAIAVNLARGRVFDCGCAGSVAAPRLITWWHVAADLLLAAVATAIAVAAPAAADLWPGPASPVHLAVPGGSALPMLLAALVCLVLTPLLQRAAAVRVLAAAARRGLGTPAMSPDPRSS